MRVLISIISVISVLVFSGTAMAAGDVAKGKTKAAMCTACHGVKGLSAVPIYPNLAGQKQQYLEIQIKAFRDEVRKSPIMLPMVKSLTDQDIADLSAYYASLKGC